MSRTITALFDTRADAEAGRQRLLDANIDMDNVNIYDKSSIGETGYSSPAAPGMWASIKNAFLPEEDRHVYEEGVRRGGLLLVADVDDDEVDEAVRALEDGHLGSVDIDERANQWKSEGWVPPVTGAAGAATVAAADRDAPAAGTTGGEAHVPVVEEQLIVGKREVERGGVRVRSYMTEQPVHEQIRLREERVNVERHAVDRPADADALREQAIEVRATGEEAVVQKTARVVEEVLVGKEVTQRQENVSDTVRHTEVQVERLGGSAQADDTYYRTHYASTYGAAGGSYDDYAPAYSYGTQMRSDARYQGRQWDDVEPDLRTDWESSHGSAAGSTWEKVKAAVRHGWDKVTR
ncbi:YsnF/AvaK domain-containing protein [Telluria mixta]|uniref:YsnF/AvaK domain-containing protein n=1 Tax=Telluria mixta TaxID=34071 RepID=A0ABT2C764_9BURK|nr:YsnF/AvaK domain-containing protein [Telluria mixta]MCS0633186.1 YsnF/AvaK domain-containing protein [Telluria mixta]WEM94671.1 YsnF/AvaK domain-containing protein [Telluria mixta]